VGKRACGAAIVAGLLLSAAPGHTLPKPKKTKGPEVSAIYDDYLTRVRNMSAPLPATAGSLWVDAGPLAKFAGDYKARQPGDLVTIKLADTFTAAASAENNQSRQFASQSSITNLIGKLGATSRLANLLNLSSSHSLNGKGASTMSSNVQLTLAAMVMETLPNGVLVVQAARDVGVGNDRQTVFIRGLVRPGDLAPDNSVVSTLVSDLQVEIKGKGAVAEASRQPNIVIRTFLKFLTF